MSRLLFRFTIVFVLLTISAAFSQKNIDVKNAGELKEALKKAKPGDKILLADGDYDFNSNLNINIKGTKTEPVKIAAKNKGKVKITGDSHIIMTGAENVIIEGFDFVSTNGPAVELRGCSYVQVTRNKFHLKETKRGLWILLTGIKGDTVTISNHNRIDHNLFEKKSELGNFITVEGTVRYKPQISQYDRIDHNLFMDIGPRVENVLEAIRAGSSEFSLSSGYTVIEENLFERCDGDPEYISIKSSDDTIRNNTFRECLGSLSLRHGNRNTVEGNFILGNGRTGTFLDSTGKKWILGAGGLRFYGTGMRIINNYLEGLTGKEWDAGFAITNGDAVYGDGKPLTKHFRIEDALISGNILVNNLSNFEIGYDGGGFQGNWWQLAPTGLKITNNIIVGTKDTLVKIFKSPEKTVWENNIVWASEGAVVSKAPIDGVKNADPKLVKEGNIWYLPGQNKKSRPLERKDVGPDSE